MGACQVTFNSEGGSEVDPEKVAFGSLITKLADPSKTGYDFAGWYKDDEFTDACDFENDTMPTNNITLYAKLIPD